MSELADYFDIEVNTNKNPVFKDITDDTYRQLEIGIYDTWGRRLNITPRVLDENGIWTGEYKDWSHLQEIHIRQSYFEYLNMGWLHIDHRPNKIFKSFCKEAYVFDTKVFVIQEVEHDYVSAKILTDNEELKIHIEDILQFKPMNIVPQREIREINDLEFQGLEFGSSQLKINMNTAEERLDGHGLVITNIDHYDNYVYQVYDSLRNIYKNLGKEKERRAAEAQTIWLEDWIDKKTLTNELDSIVPFMTDEVINELSKYTYKDKSLYDRQACGGYLFDETEFKEFSIEEMDYIIVKGKRMDKICKQLDIPITIGWDIWKILNKDIMQKVINRLYREYE